MKKTSCNSNRMERHHSNKAQAMQQLYKKLDEAQAAVEAGDKGISHIFKSSKLTLAPEESLLYIVIAIRAIRCNRLLKNF